MKTRLVHWIDNAHFAGTGPHSDTVYHPATGDAAATLAYGDADDTRAAIAAARRALPDWAAKTPLARARILFRFKAPIEAHADELASGAVFAPPVAPGGWWEAPCCWWTRSCPTGPCASGC